MRPIRKTTAIICAVANMFAAAPRAAEFSIREMSMESEAIDDSRGEWLDRVEEARKRYEAFAASVQFAWQNADDVASSRASHMEDWTLRAGDIVVTETGLLLFKGSQNFPHESCDFERVGEKHIRSLPHRRALLEILRAAERRGP